MVSFIICWTLTACVKKKTLRLGFILTIVLSKVGWLAVLSVSELFFSATKNPDIIFLLSTTSFCSELRDQGLTRPKILILVPFRDAALKVVEVIMHLICPDEGVSKILFCLIPHNISLLTPLAFYQGIDGE